MKASFLALLAIALSGNLAFAQEQDYKAAVNSYRAGNYTNAASLLNKVVLAHPEDANAAYYQALCAQQLGQFDKAKALFRSLSERFPERDAGRLARRALQQLSVQPPQARSEPKASKNSSADNNTLPDNACVPFSRMTGGHLLVRGAIN